LEREELIYLAQLAEQCERYEEMVSYVKAVVEKEDRDLSTDERFLLSVAYKNTVGSRRSAWRVLRSIESKESSCNAARNKHYRGEIENELVEMCEELLRLIDERLLVNANDAAARVFYCKMKGDYYRYISELPQNELISHNSHTLIFYQDAMNVAYELPPTHPTRLGLALNLSLFYYETLQSPQQACQLAKQAFDAAITELDTLPEEHYRDSVLLMQLLRDNLTQWTQEAAG
jgi:hypothetical protein